MPIENRNLQVGTRLVANYKKVHYVCTVERAEEGEGMVYTLEDGKKFKSPSSAASAVMGGKAVNGWRFWSLEGDAPEAEAAPAKKRTSKRKSGLFRRLPATGLEEGQYRIWCSACQKSFITTESEPEACPQGHRADDPELNSPVGEHAQ